MASTPTPDYLAILEVLQKHGVKFIVVGGVSAVLNGAPVNTWDLDIVPDRSSKNLPRLLAALEELDAFYREPGPRRLRPKLGHLDSPDHSLFRTIHGHFDILGTVAGDRDYRSLLPHVRMMRVGTGVKVMVLDLAMLIQLKEETGRDRDRAVLPILRQTLREQQGPRGRRQGRRGQAPG